MGVLDAIPEKREEIEETREENSIHIIKDKSKNASLMMKFLIWARQTSHYHRVDIEDPVGMRIWELIDGNSSVGAIAGLIEQEMREQEQFRHIDKDAITHSTIQFMRMLSAARLIGYKK
jgi:hypothetical protein